MGTHRPSQQPPAAAQSTFCESPCRKDANVDHSESIRNRVLPAAIITRTRRRNLCVPSQVSPAYAPPGAALISATVLGIPAIDERQLEL